MAAQAGKNYNIISPTAKYVLLFKGYTEIPYAREVAELVSLPGKYQPDFGKRDFTWWATVLHLENRYKSINQLLLSLPVKNVLELSSGYSFRGLSATQDHDLYYIDTDLPEMINTKKELLSDLHKPATAAKGKLEILPLNALDEQQFAEITDRFPKGEIAIVNEGLLMYLDVNEKKKLCKLIRETLQQRGGYWITADIYIKTKNSLRSSETNAEVQKIFDKLNVEDNKFDSFETAEEFFKNEGFIIDKEAIPEYEKSTALKYLLESATEDQLSSLNNAGKIHATWRLKLTN